QSRELVRALYSTAGSQPRDRSDAKGVAGRRVLREERDVRAAAEPANRFGSGEPNVEIASRRRFEHCAEHGAAARVSKHPYRLKQAYGERRFLSFGHPRIRGRIERQRIEHRQEQSGPKPTQLTPHVRPRILEAVIELGPHALELADGLESFRMLGAILGD